MLTYIYRSVKREGLYLYLLKRDDFSMIPKELIEIFGQPVFSMVFDLSKKSKLAIADINKVKESLINEGFFLQVPPPPEDLLKQLQQQKLQ